MSFILDSKLAAQADRTPPISSPCAAVGVITQAWEETSQAGAVALKLNFKREDGAEARHITIWHTAKNGQRIDSGINKINALLYCLKVREAKKISGKIKRWNNDTKKEEDETAAVYPDFCNKKIGVCLGVEFYNDKQKMVLDCAFDAESKKTASELINKTEERIVDAYIAKYAKQPEKKSESVEKSEIDFDDDIPF